MRILFSANLIQDQESPLHKAAKRGHIDVVQTLIKSEANVHVKNEVCINGILNVIEPGYNVNVRRLFACYPFAIYVEIAILINLL